MDQEHLGPIEAKALIARQLDAVIHREIVTLVHRPALSWHYATIRPFAKARFLSTGSDRPARMQITANLSGKCVGGQGNSHSPSQVTE